jgi:hypothetical protein
VLPLGHLEENFPVLAPVILRGLEARCTDRDVFDLYASFLLNDRSTDCGRQDLHSAATVSFEIAYILHRRGVALEDKIWRTFIAGSALRLLEAKPGDMDVRRAAYEYTHAVFFAFDFGRCERQIEKVDAYQEITRALALRAQSLAEWDLVIELCICLLSFPGGEQIAREVMGPITLELCEGSYVLSEGVVCKTREGIEDIYCLFHASLVSLILIAVMRWRRGQGWNL